MFPQDNSQGWCGHRNREVKTDVGKRQTTVLLPCATCLGRLLSHTQTSGCLAEPWEVLFWEAISPLYFGVISYLTTFVTYPYPGYGHYPGVLANAAEPNSRFGTEFSDFEPCSSPSATPCLRCLDGFNCDIAMCLLFMWPHPHYTVHRGQTICWEAQEGDEPRSPWLQDSCQAQGWAVSEGCWS